MIAIAIIFTSSNLLRLYSYVTGEAEKDAARYIYFNDREAYNTHVSNISWFSINLVALAAALSYSGYRIFKWRKSNNRQK